MDDFELELRKTLRKNRDVHIGADEIGSARGLVTEIFRFRSRLIAVSSVAKIVLLLVLAVLFAAMAFASDGGRSCYLSGFLSLVCLIALSTIWQFHWMLLNRNAVLRELKRLEVQLVANELRERSSRGDAQ